MKDHLTTDANELNPELTAILREVAEVEMPEPSPLFWNHLSARVRTAIAEEPQGSGWAGEWWHWRRLAPLAALVLMVTSLVLTVALDRDVATSDLVAATESSGVALDAEWSLVADLVGTLDLQAVDDAVIRVAPGTVEDAALELDVDERVELIRLLRAEIARAGG